MNDDSDDSIFEEEQEPGTSESEVQCPFCGETFTIIVDTSVSRQTYIEDCSVCCRPITFSVECEEGYVISINAERD